MAAFFMVSCLSGPAVSASDAPIWCPKSRSSPLAVPDSLHAADTEQEHFHFPLFHYIQTGHRTSDLASHKFQFCLTPTLFHLHAALDLHESDIWPVLQWNLQNRDSAAPFPIMWLCNSPDCSFSANSDIVGCIWGDFAGKTFANMLIFHLLFSAVKFISIKIVSQKAGKYNRIMWSST